MLFKKVIIGVAIAGAVGILAKLAKFALKKYYKKSNNRNPELSYSVTEHNTYDINNIGQIYTYRVTTSTFDELEQHYKRDFLGNYKKKEHVDLALQQYLKTNVIYQKRIIIITEGWVGYFNVETSVNTNTLVFEIDNNSLEEAINDGLYQKSNF
jgi:hypothetical protein